MYSTDRSKALENTLSCLKGMDLYESCQKTLIVDGKIDFVPADWEAIQVPRIQGKFCWGRMWDAGVGSAKYNKIVYLDSDRLLPASYLKQVHEKVQDDLFLFTSLHFMMTMEMPIESSKKFLQSLDMRAAISNTEFLGRVRYEPRHGSPFHGPSKNVMSGSTAFTKNTYFRLGGVDHWYCGHGAYADSDFHMSAATQGVEFLDLQLLELHFPHKKLSDANNSLSSVELDQLSLDNFIYYCDKWSLSLTLAENLAVRCNIKNPKKYVDKKLSQIKANAKVS